MHGKRRLMGTLLVLALLAGARPTRADGAAPAPESSAPVRLGFRLRVQVPYLTWTLLPDRSDFLPSFFGLSLAAELDRRWALEVGSSRLPIFGGHNGGLGADAFVRAGLGLKLAGHGGPGGWTHRLVVYGGYRYLVLDLENDGEHEAWPHHGLVANLGLEISQWFTRRWGWSARLLTGFDLLLRRRPEPTQWDWRALPTGPYGARFAFDLGVDLGLAF